MICMMLEFHESWCDCSGQVRLKIGEGAKSAFQISLQCVDFLHMDDDDPTTSKRLLILLGLKTPECYLLNL
jgi:hypothetical protein